MTMIVLGASVSASALAGGPDDLTPAGTRTSGDRKR